MTILISRAAAPGAARRSIACLIVAATLAAGATSSSAHAAVSAQAPSRALTIYAVPATVQYLNNADDRLRGISNNPFSDKTAKIIKLLAVSGQEKTTGPLPGDTALYSYKLYTGASLDRRAGSAIFTCQYGFDETALCVAYYELSGGTVLASGPVVFNSTRFTLAVRGGTNEYLGARGGLTESRVAKTGNAVRLRFMLLG
jgi:methionine-rich copper-binding protein CopC